MNDRTKKFRIRFLHWFCPDHLLEEIEGDLMQRFERDVLKFGKRKARWRMFFNTLKFFRPGIILRNNPSLPLNPIHMIANYFKVALRVMFRNKAFTGINISGLTLGITAALLLFLWIGHEFSYEQFHVDKDRLFQAWNRAGENGQISCWSTTPRVLSPTLEKEYAFVDHAISYAQWGVQHLFTVGDVKLMKTSGVFVDPAFLTMFTFPLVKGDPSKALNDPNSIVITETFAQQLFGYKEALGESVKISQEGYSFEFTVSGILKELPSNTEFKFEYLLPFSFVETFDGPDTFWGNNSVQTFVKLKEGSELEVVNEQIKDIEKKHYADGQHIEIFLYPLTQQRLYSRFENGVNVGGRIEVMRVLGILGICLVVIACINFINLSTARAQRRAKEVAVRKVTGAIRMALVFQFLCESIMIAWVAGIISFGIAYLALPFFNTLIKQNLAFNFGDVSYWLRFGIFITAIGMLAGCYPAVYLSSFRPARILKGAGLTVSGRNTMRNLLVIFQFGFAITLIVSVIVVQKQIHYVQNRDSGYSRDNLIYIPLTGDLGKNYGSFKNELIQSGTAVSVTKTSAPITEQWSSTTEIQWKGKNPDERIDFERIYVDENVSSTIKLTIVKGRDMDLKKFSTDSTAAIINETAMHIMGFENPVGEIIRDNGKDWKIVGVVKDFVFLSPFQKIEPIILFGCKPSWAFSTVYIKLSKNQSNEENLNALSTLAKKYNPEFPFEYQFADEEYQQKFNNVEATLTITLVFTSIAIFIACLGLLGLSTYMTEARVKEIGIRKVMGGSVLSITRLLGLSSIKPIFYSILIFLPLSWLSMNWWLQSFAFRTSLNIWVFFLAALAILLIAMLTIGFNTIRAANTNPAESLRNE